MIPQTAITAWSKQVPWPGADQVEHDLVLSRAICELYQNSVIRENLAFRGGTALHKLFFDKAGRFSEDLDFVQIKAGPIGNVITAIRSILDPWLGQPSWKQNHGRFTLNYYFETEMLPVTKRKVKVEINTREHNNVKPYITKKINVLSTWFSGEADVLTYELEELLGTKFRALYQRKRGRDLYDFWYVLNHYPNLDIKLVLDIFQYYMAFGNTPVTLDELKQNIELKRNNRVFNQDIFSLLDTDQITKYKMDDAFDIIFDRFIKQLEKT
jgi:predicted nucleotidyltransferase component of viral defense system